MNIFTLKLIAAFAMLLDHIGLFFPNLKISLFFHWIGRIAAPIFIFGIINGLKHTHSKRFYLIRLYIGSVAMSIIQAFTEIHLNFFRTLFVIACIICILEEKRENPSKSTRKRLPLYILYQVFSCTFCIQCLANSTTIHESVFYYILPAILGNVFLMEGGIVYVFLGIFMYLFFEHKRNFSLSYIGFILFYMICSATDFLPIVLWRIIQNLPIIGNSLAECLDFLLSTIIGFLP